MTPTSAPQSAPPEAPRRLYRLTDQRRWAGVAAGIGWYLNVDPVLIRIAFIVAGFATGPLAVGAYIACWALLPSRRAHETGTEAPPPSDGRTRVLTAIGIVVALSLMGALNWGSGQVILAAGLIGIGVLVFQGGGAPQTSRRLTDWGSSSDAQDDDDAAHPGPQRAYDRPYAASHGHAADWGAGWTADDGTRSEDCGPPWSGPLSAAPWRGRQARERTERSRLGPVIVALTMIGLGLAAMMFNLGVVPLSPVRALGIVVGMAGAGLIVGTVYGRARWLIPVGIVGSIMLAAAGAVMNGPVPFIGPTGDFQFAPTTVEELPDAYTLGAGELLIDLTQLQLDPGQIAPITVDAGAGDVQILVSPEHSLDLEGDLGAGDANVFGTTASGFDVPLGAARSGTNPKGGTLSISVDQLLGEFTITDGGPR